MHGITALGPRTSALLSDLYAQRDYIDEAIRALERLKLLYERHSEWRGEYESTLDEANPAPPNAGIN